MAIPAHGHRAPRAEGSLAGSCLVASLRPHGATCLLSSAGFLSPFMCGHRSLCLSCAGPQLTSRLSPQHVHGCHLALRVAAVTAGLSFSPDRDLVLSLITKVHVLTRHSNGQKSCSRFWRPGQSWHCFQLAVPVHVLLTCEDLGASRLAISPAGFHINILVYFSPNPRPGTFRVPIRLRPFLSRCRTRPLSPLGLPRSQ